MNALVLKDQHKTMTSRDIAELTGSDHHNVLATIRKLVREGVIFAHETLYTHASNNQTYPQFEVGFRDTMVIVSGYSADLRAKIIDRWQELEAGGAPRFQIPTTLAGALRLAAEQAETIEQQALAIVAAAPAVEFVAKYADSTGLKGFRQVCKLLGAKENDFREFLLDKKIMYRLGGEWMPHAAHLDTGRFVVKAGTSDVSGHAFNSAKFTAKGINWVAGEYAKHKLGAV